jgi:histone H4
VHQRHVNEWKKKDLTNVGVFGAPCKVLVYPLQMPDESVVEVRKIGIGQGQAGRKRHLTKMLRGNLNGISKPGIRRLARRGGVKQVSGLVYKETRNVLKTFLENVIRDTVTYTAHARRKTVTSNDVVYALKGQGITLYEFGL